MSGQLRSNRAVASEKKAELVSALDGYTSFAAQPASGCADGVPPQDHDARTGAYTSALSSYASSLERDADALEQIGIAFDESDSALASALLGVG